MADLIVDGYELVLCRVSLARADANDGLCLAI